MFVLRLFKDVLAIFTWLEFKKVSIAVASRTMQPPWAEKALWVFKTTSGTPFRQLIEASECYEDCKQRHLKAICKKLKVNLRIFVCVQRGYSC